MYARINKSIVKRRNGNFYGDFYNMVNPKWYWIKKCPKELHPLLPMQSSGEFQMILCVKILVEAANKDICDNLKEVINEYDDLIDQWLASDEAYSESPSKEYIAFSAMRMAADYI
jgi:hypothetical protein